MTGALRMTIAWPIVAAPTRVTTPCLSSPCGSRRRKRSGSLMTVIVGYGPSAARWRRAGPDQPCRAVAIGPRGHGGTCLSIMLLDQQFVRPAPFRAVGRRGDIGERHAATARL